MPLIQVGTEACQKEHQGHPANNAKERGVVEKHINFLHHSPGRIRIRVKGLKGNAQLSEAIHSTANKVYGVKQISASTVTGSVLICYDHADPHVLPHLQSMMNDAEELLGMGVTDPAAFTRLLSAYAKEK